MFLQYSRNPHPLQESGTTWLPITQAGRGQAWEVLFEQVPNGAGDNIEIDDLGASMKLIKNRWYVDSRHINLHRAEELQKVARFTCLQWLAGLTIIGFGIVFLVREGNIDGWVTVGVAVLAGLMLLADYLIQRRF